MSRFVSLLWRDETLCINVSKIEYIDYDNEGTTQIHMDSGQIVKVDDLIGDVLDKIHLENSK